MNEKMQELENTLMADRIVPAILEQLNRLEEGEIYEIASIPITHNPQLSKEDALKYLKIFESKDFNDPFCEKEKFDDFKSINIKHIIVNCSPEIKLIDNNSFKIVSSKVYRSLSNLHRAFNYFVTSHPYGKVRKSYKIPKRLRTREFEEKVGEYFIKAEDDSYFYSEAGVNAREALDSAIWYISMGHNIDEEINKLYGEELVSSKQPQAAMVGKIDGKEKKNIK